MNLHTKIPDKTLANQKYSIKESIRELHTGMNWVLFQEYVQGWFNIQKPITITSHINTLQKRNYILSYNLTQKKNIWQNSKRIHDFKKTKTLSKLQTEENFPNLIENIYKNPIINIVLNYLKKFE